MRASRSRMSRALNAKAFLPLADSFPTYTSVVLYKGCLLFIPAVPVPLYFSVSVELLHCFAMVSTPSPYSVGPVFKPRSKGSLL
jgi:hypothetical protein